MEGAKGEVTFTFEKRQEVKVRKDDLANSSVLHRMVKRRFFGGEGWANTFAWRPPKNISLSVGVGSSKRPHRESAKARHLPPSIEQQLPHRRGRFPEGM